jgi:RNA polymerase sigma-70 factor (ECF subfamily)
MPNRESAPTLFATTQWTVVCDAARGGDTGAIQALESLLGTYWRPLYRYLRRLGCAAPDAEDLVQGFFAHLLAHDGLQLVDRGRGRFRAFLLGSLKHYMANEWQREHRLKRGGFAEHLSIDWQQAESGLAFEPADTRTPDLCYDFDWATALLDQVLDDLARSESDFDRWKPFLSIGGERVRYAEIGAQLGMTESAARVAVHRLRKRFRERLRQEIARTLSDDALVEDEMQALFAALTQRNS